MPLDPSVTSASEGPWWCTLRYSSALLPKSFERPGPKSVRPATNCSGVEVVVWGRWIVDMRAPRSTRHSKAASRERMRVRGAIVHQTLVSVQVGIDQYEGIPDTIVQWNI